MGIKIVFWCFNFFVNLGEVMGGAVFVERRVLLVLMIILAEVAQLVEYLLPKQKVASSSLVFRSKDNLSNSKNPGNISFPGFHHHVVFYHNGFP